MHNGFIKFKTLQKKSPAIALTITGLYNCIFVTTSAQGLNVLSSDLISTFAGLHILTKLRFEKQKLQLINSSELDLTLEFLFYS